MKRYPVFFVFLFLSFYVPQSFAVLPVVIGALAREAVVVTAESVAVSVLARGFAANDPYVKTTATISRSAFRRNLLGMRGPVAVGAALGLIGLVRALDPDYDYKPDLGFVKAIHSLPSGGVCRYGSNTYTSLDSCIDAFLKFNPTHVIRVTDPAEQGVSTCMANLNQIDCSFVSVYSYDSRNFPNEAFRFSYFYPTGPDILSYEPLSEAEIDPAITSFVSSSSGQDLFSGLSRDQISDLFDGADVPYSPTRPDLDTSKKMDLYKAGLLQYTDPNAENYVDWDEYARIGQLVEAETRLNSDSGKLDQLNDSLEQPITQVQYDESNLKTDSLNASSFKTSVASSLSPFDTLQSDRQDIIDQMGNPSEPPDSVSFLTWDLPTGQCNGYTLEGSVHNGKLSAPVVVDGYCRFYYETGEPLLYWLFNILTFLYVFLLWDKSVSDMARGG